MSAEEFYRFEERHVLGVVNSLECNTVYDVTGRYAVCGALENVYVWDLRTGELFAKWIDSENNSLVCHIRRSSFDSDMYAVGYVDGSIRVWSFSDHTQPRIVFKGHKSAVVCFAFSEDGARLASGAKDSDIVLWDLAAESGLFRLLGHSNTVTTIDFMPNAPNHLISASKDTLVKIWDLSTQHCIETVVAHRTEVTSLAFFDSGAILLTAGAEHHIKIFAVDYDALERKLMTSTLSNETVESPDILKCLGHVDRVTKERVINLSHFDQDHFGLLSADKSVELWRVRSSDEIKKKINRRIKRAREKAKTTGNQVEINEKAEPNDLLQSLLIIRPKHKSSSVDFIPKKQRLILSHNDNTLVEYAFELPERENEESRVGTFELIKSVDLPGHRAEVRSVAISHSRELFATASAEAIKVWNVESGTCVITMEAEQVPTCISFIEEDRCVLIGTKEGMLNLYEIANGTMILSKKAHDSTINSLHNHPKLPNSFITGSNDKTVHFWKLKRSSRNDELKFKHIRTLQLTESVICVRYSPDASLIAASLFDMTVKVFFEDTLKFHLSFYGHKLPVTTLDFSHDCKFLLTGSHDKNVKVWAMEFGDCRKNLFAHNEPIQSVRFVYSGTGYDFITAGRDGLIKYWTMKEYELLQKMTSHHREIWAVEVAGQMEGFGRSASCLLVSASHDRSIRVWEQTGEQIFLEEERERQMEEIIEHSMMEDNPHGENEPQRATLKTVSAMKAGERLYEFIEEADKEREMWDTYHSIPGSPEPTPGPLSTIIGKAKKPAELVYWAISRIPTPDLEQALLCLPFLHVKSLLLYIREWIDNISHIVLSTRVLNCVIRLFFNQIATDSTLKTLMIDISRIHKERLQEVRDLLGVNLVMVNDILKSHKEQHTATLFEKLTISQFPSKKHQLDE